MLVFTYFTCLYIFLDELKKENVHCIEVSLELELKQLPAHLQHAYRGRICGGHFGGTKKCCKSDTIGLFLAYLFKDANTFFKACDRFQRVGNISIKQEMSLTNILKIELYCVWSIVWDHFHNHLETFTSLLLWTMYPNGYRQ